jgi:Flp pilus assembly protein TadG
METLRILRYKRPGRATEKGSILALSAIGMSALLLAAGLSIDINHLYAVSTELQNAADAAALSAASSLNSTAGGITTAVDRALANINYYEFNTETATIGRKDVRFAVNLSEFDNGGTGRDESQAAANPQNVRFVQVTVPPKSVTFSFAGMAMGSNTFTLTRSAVAGQSAGLNVLCNVVPISVVEDPATGAPLNVNPECPDKTRFTPGCTYICRLGPSGSGNGENCDTISAGNYQILALNSDRGGADVRHRLAIGSDICMDPGKIVHTEPGIKAGAVHQGFNTRFDEYTGALDPEKYPPDTNIKTKITYDQYRSGLTMYQRQPSHTGVSNRRVIIVPIIKKDQFENGRDTVRIDRFGAFFLQDKIAEGNGGNIRVEYIADRVVVGDGGYLPSGGAGNPRISVPVLFR